MSMAHFQATTSAEPGRTVVALAGECDLAYRDDLASVLLGAVRTAKVVLVDLADLTFLDSSGVHCLVVAHQAARQTGGRLYVDNAAGTVAAVLDLTGVGALLNPVADGHDHSA